jgi:Spy/CpxP family protein refolding chaperone
MRIKDLTGPLILALAASCVLAVAPTAAATEAPRALPVAHEEMGRTFDDLMAQLEGLAERWRGHFAGADGWSERPLVSFMLSHREELGLSAAQTQELERLRAGFQREAIKRDADLRIAEMDLSGLLGADPVDMGKVEGKVREIERGRADLRLARIRAIEQGKALLSRDQRAKLETLLAEPWRRGPRRSWPAAPPFRRQSF